MLKSTEHQAHSAMQPITSWIEGYSRRQQFRRMAESLLKEKDDTLSDLGYDRHAGRGACDGHAAAAGHARHAVTLLEPRHDACREPVRHWALSSVSVSA